MEEKRMVLNGSSEIMSEGLATFVNIVYSTGPEYTDFSVLSSIFANYYDFKNDPENDEMEILSMVAFFTTSSLTSSEFLPGPAKFLA